MQQDSEESFEDVKDDKNQSAFNIWGKASSLVNNCALLKAHMLRLDAPMTSQASG